MFGNLKIKATVIGGIVVVLFGHMLHDANDLKTNYKTVDASITKVTIDCYIKKRRRKIIDSRTNKMAYMDCEIAPLVAAKHDYSEHDVHKRATIQYRYTSPVDKRMYDGSFELTGRFKLEKYVPGTNINVYAHKTKPTDSRRNSNPLVGENGV
ncbi:MAG: hypothetical protein ABJM26_08355 [Anderseniella sp.]